MLAARCGAGVQISKLSVHLGGLGSGHGADVAFPKSTTPKSSPELTPIVPFRVPVGRGWGAVAVGGGRRTRAGAAHSSE